MLYEFAFTPDTFDASLLNHDPVLPFTLIQLLRGVAENGLLANLNKGRWIRHIKEQRLENLSPDLRRKLMACLELLDKRNRLVRHPRRKSGKPKNDLEWLELALDSHRRTPLHGIVLGQELLNHYRHHDEAFIELSGALDSARWQNRRRSITLTQSEADYRKHLAPVLRHARALTLIDPYMTCRSSRFFRTIKLCTALLGQRGDAVLNGRIHIHADDPVTTGSHQESVENRLNAWEKEVRKLRKPPHRFEIFLWRMQPGGQKFHDRYIMTDQCGISAPAGLDCQVRSDNTTTWTLLDEADRAYHLQKYDPAANTYKFLGSRKIK